MFFRFPPDARWSAEQAAVEFGIGFGEYEGVVRISRRVFQSVLDQAPTPERCLEAYHLDRTHFELIAERKLRRRQLTDDLNVEITGRVSAGARTGFCGKTTAFRIPPSPSCELSIGCPSGPDRGS